MFTASECYFLSFTVSAIDGSDALHRELKEALNEQVGHMNKVTFPNACQLMRWHFHPVGFEGSMDAPAA